jgi:hypothetical protein
MGIVERLMRRLGMRAAPDGEIREVRQRIEDIDAAMETERRRRKARIDAQIDAQRAAGQR